MKSGLKIIEKDSHDVHQKITDLKNRLQRGRELVEKMPGIQHTKEDQMKRIDVLRKQLITKFIMEEEVHPIFEQDPAQWMQYVSKKVSILTENGQEHIGWVYTVDPVSSTFVLAQFSVDDKTEIEIVMGHAVKKVTILDVGNVEENSPMKEEMIHEKLNSLFVHTMSSRCSDSDLMIRKEQLRTWLLKNRLPVKEKDDRSLCIADAVTVAPPYTSDACSSVNEIILAKIQGLIKNMPKELDGL